MSPMTQRALRAWLQAAVLLPAVLALAVAAVVLAARTTPPSRPAGGVPPPPADGAAAGQATRPGEPGVLVIPLSVPAEGGGSPVALVVRITTAPPVPEAALQASRGYLVDLLRSLVRSQPPGWAPDASGIAVLRHAIEEAVPVALLPALPRGTQVAVSADVAGGPPGAPSP